MKVPYSLRGMATIGIFLFVWEVCPRLGWVDPILLPPFSAVFKRAIELGLEGGLWGHIFSSLWRVALGFALSGAIALPLGVFLGLFKKADPYVEPLLGLFRPLAPPAWIPLAILWFGIGDKPAVFIIFVGTFFSTLTGVIAATRRLDKDLLMVAFTLGASLKQAIWRVVLPGLMPTVFAHLRIGLGLAWMCVVASEMVAVKRGIGFMMMEARNLFRTEDILVGMGLVGLAGFLMDRLLKALEGKVIRWRRGLSAHELLETRIGQ